MVVHAYNSNSQETEVGGKKSEACLGYILRPCLTKQQKPKQKKSSNN
jgi:hypothetical protein